MAALFFFPGSGSAFPAPLVAAFIILLAATSSLPGAEAAQFIVGGDAGWTLPSFGHVKYTDWSAQNKYHRGDTLVFNYAKDYHNLLVVDKLDFLSCSIANPIATFQDGRTVIGLNITGPHFYICGVPGHCSQGQKLMVVVRSGGHHRSAAAATASASAPAPAQSFPAVRNPLNGPAEGPSSAAPAKPRVPLAAAVLLPVLGHFLARLLPL